MKVRVASMRLRQSDQVAIRVFIPGSSRQCLPKSLGLELTISVFELCLILKYVELNGNKSDPVPWSVRQMVLYQKLDKSCQQEAVLLVRASEDMKRRVLEELQENPNAVQCWSHWTNVLLLAISTLSRNWSEYIKFLDLAVWKIVGFF